MDYTNLLKYLANYWGRLICTILGLAAAISFLTLGFFKTLVVLICCGIGYFAGLLHDKGIDIILLIRNWRSR